MSELISGKEALIALANGEEVQTESNKQWVSVENCQVYQFLYNNCNYKFRLKPRTITLNNIEVPAPFEPKDGEVFWHIFPTLGQGYGWCYGEDESMKQFGAWRTEEEIKQVVAALKKIFVINNQ